jgi:hypothetical protein
MCDGTVVPGNIWCGKLSVPENTTTYTVSVGRQQVFETLVGVTLTLHNCDVLDPKNWECTTYYDDTGYETDRGHGKCFDRTFMQDGLRTLVRSDPCPRESPTMRAMDLAGNKQDFVYVPPWDYWAGKTLNWWEKRKGIWGIGAHYTFLADPSELVCRSYRVP